MSIAERLALAPELRDTTRWDKPRESDIPEDDLEEYRRRKKAVTAYLKDVYKRQGDDQDLKGAALLFVSDAGKHITGQILAVDGGYTAV